MVSWSDGQKTKDFVILDKGKQRFQIYDLISDQFDIDNHLWVHTILEVLESDFDDKCGMGIIFYFRFVFPWKYFDRNILFAL